MFRKILGISMLAVAVWSIYYLFDAYIGHYITYFDCQQIWLPIGIVLNIIGGICLIIKGRRMQDNA